MALTGREVCRSRGAAGRRQRLPVSVNGLQMDSRIHLGAGGGDVNGICLTNIYWVRVVQSVFLVVWYS